MGTKVQQPTTRWRRRTPESEIAHVRAQRARDAQPLARVGVGSDVRAALGVIVGCVASAEVLACKRGATCKTSAVMHTAQQKQAALRGCAAAESRTNGDGVKTRRDGAAAQQARHRCVEPRIGTGGRR